MGNMKLKRFYFEKENLTGDKIVLSGEEFVHAVSVMRARVGDKACLFCGDGLDYICTFAEIGKKSATLTVDEVNKNESESPCNLTVFQALAKGEKLTLIAQKLTEIGATEMAVFYSKFCDVKPNSNRPERLEKVAISASKQCGRSRVLNCQSEVLTLSDIAKKIKEFDAVLFAYENAQDNFLASAVTALAKKQKNKIALIVGPEGGFDAQEVEFLTSAGAQVVTLGKRILRTETCAISASAVIIGVYESLASA